tara:strand:+ start:203 stop:481 length:279 start_codon:yes stop_codon:yes gene_type:complete
LIISALLLSSCNTTNDAVPKYQIIDGFRNSSEYKEYLKSDRKFNQAIVKFKIVELNEVISLANSGEAKAFEEYVRNHTQLTLEPLIIIIDQP